MPSPITHRKTAFFAAFALGTVKNMIRMCGKPAVPNTNANTVLICARVEGVCTPMVIADAASGIACRTAAIAAVALAGIIQALLAGTVANASPAAFAAAAEAATAAAFGPAMLGGTTCAAISNSLLMLPSENNHTPATTMITMATHRNSACKTWL